MGEYDSSLSVKEYLKEYKVLLAREEQLKSVYKSVMDIDAIGAIDYTASRVQISRGESLIDKILVKREAARDKYNDSVIERLEYLNNITDITLSMKNPIYSSLIYKRYVELKDWWEVANELGYSEEHTRARLHRKALEQAQIVMNSNPAYK